MEQDLENAFDDVERFFEKYRGLTALGRKMELPKLNMLLPRIAALTQSDEYVLENITRLSDACKNLARQRQATGYRESDDAAYGLGAIGNMRSRAEYVFPDSKAS